MIKGFPGLGSIYQEATEKFEQDSSSTSIVFTDFHGQKVMMDPKSISRIDKRSGHQGYQTPLKWFYVFHLNELSSQYCSETSDTEELAEQWFNEHVSTKTKIKPDLVEKK